MLPILMAICNPNNWLLVNDYEGHNQGVAIYSNIILAMQDRSGCDRLTLLFLHLETAFKTNVDITLQGEVFDENS